MDVGYIEPGIESLAGPDAFITRRLTLALVGQQAAGKTSLIRALIATEGGDDPARAFSKAYKMTVGPEITALSMATPGGGYARLNIIDIPGLSTNIGGDDVLFRRFLDDPSLLMAFVFDVNSPLSAQGLDGWWKLIEKTKTANRTGFIRGVIVGTKTDLPRSHDREEAEAIGRAFARRAGMDYYLTSSAAVGGVKGPFEHLTELASVEAPNY
ncbi:hypothetical protein FOZ63_026151 [Perkinsus olseni]|uniref:GTP-binding protein n=1 Tax=Perkinsus olseni TaxID=32597 RepID=A0A7J6N577_PEROL|nr:hypothetical protein FOZ60_015527 [Perkinsus olseni]KAF4725524.1 hypothetical protein FOZ63_026151 [Perkinsus olseni]KAF4725678.1 hypothetical protein FOZ62_002779 [Perkinsus olseni]